MRSIEFAGENDSSELFWGRWEMRAHRGSPWQAWRWTGWRRFEWSCRRSLAGRVAAKRVGELAGVSSAMVMPLSLRFQRERERERGEEENEHGRELEDVAMEVMHTRQADERA